jgi:glucokinase
MTDGTRPTDRAAEGSSAPNYVAEVIQAGGSEPARQVPATDGRDRPLIVGIDVGGSKVAVLVVDGDERVLAREIAATGVIAPERAIDEIAAVVGLALATAGATIDDIAALGVGVPGRVDPETGAVTLAVNLGWSDLPLGGRLEARFGRPVRVENDVRAAALGLHRRRVVGAIDDLAYLAIGTGVSAGIVLDGRLHRGARGLAGEIGHLVVDPDGVRCACGQRGCLETFVSGRAIARLANEAVDAGRPTVLAADPARSAVDVYRAAATGDPLAVEIAEGVGARLAWAVHLLVMTYDVERVVLGGGVSHAGDAFERPIQRELDRMRESSALANEQLVPGIVDLLPPDANAGAWGAVTIAATAHARIGSGHGWEVGHVRET